MPDSSFERIRTRRLVIRRFTPGDARALSEYRSDPEVARFQGWQSPYTEEAARAFIQSLSGSHPGVPGEWYQFAAAIRRTGRLAGDCAMLLDAGDPAVAELGCTFDPRSQGRGYAGEALRALMNYAASALGVTRLVAVTDRENLTAIRLVSRLGFGEHTEPDRQPPSGPLGAHERLFERATGMSG